jgi:soluble lytic murein transglycosylase-like protein
MKLLFLTLFPLLLSAGYSDRVLSKHQDLMLNPKLFEQTCKPSEFTAIERAIEKYCVSPDLCRAVILVESGCNSKSRSKSGDYGLMQVNRVHGIFRGIDENIKAGAEILESNFWIMLKEFKFDLPEALQKGLYAYNRGITAVKKQIFKEKSDKDQADLFWCQINFHCNLETN